MVGFGADNLSKTFSIFTMTRPKFVLGAFIMRTFFIGPAVTRGVVALFSSIPITHTKCK